MKIETTERLARLEPHVQRIVLEENNQLDKDLPLFLMLSTI